jgi:hypothetical protein
MSGGSFLAIGRIMANRASDEEAVFHAARRIRSPQERAEFLRGACGDDAALLERSRPCCAYTTRKTASAA